MKEKIHAFLMSYGANSFVASSNNTVTSDYTKTCIRWLIYGIMFLYISG